LVTAAWASRITGEVKILTGVAPLVDVLNKLLHKSYPMLPTKPTVADYRMRNLVILRTPDEDNPLSRQRLRVRVSSSPPFFKPRVSRSPSPRNIQLFPQRLGS
jgi:hypothetical protein